MQSVNMTSSGVTVNDLRSAAQLQQRAHDSRTPFTVVFDASTVAIEQENDRGPFREHREYAGEPGRWVYAFSDVAFLSARPTYQEAEPDEEPFWTSRQGSVLRDQVPPEVGIVLDPGQPWAAIVRHPRLERAGQPAT